VSLDDTNIRRLRALIAGNSTVISNARNLVDLISARLVSRRAVILLVEDDPDDVLLITDCLKAADKTILVKNVADGQEAVDYLSGTKTFSDRNAHPLPDLVLLDIFLPKLDGLEVLKWMRSQRQFDELPVVLLSNFPPDPSKIAGFNLISFESKNLLRADSRFAEKIESWIQHPKS
jgi:CheY-like chemotaxis protein